MITWHINLEPPTKTWQVNIRPIRRKDGRPGIATSPPTELKKWQRALNWLIVEARTKETQIQWPLQGAVEIWLTFIYPYRKTEKKKYTNEGLLVPKDTKPDGDNVEKTINDTLQKAGIIKDDSQLWKVVRKKYWGPAPEITIEFPELAGKKRPRF